MTIGPTPAEENEETDVERIDHLIDDANDDIASLRERVEEIGQENIDQAVLLAGVKTTLDELQRILRTVGVVISAAIEANGNNHNTAGEEEADTS